MEALLSRDDIVCIVLDMMDTKIIIPKYAYKKPKGLFLEEYIIVNSLPPIVFNSYPKTQFSNGNLVSR